jgi:hypothetical protein
MSYVKWNPPHAATAARKPANPDELRITYVKRLNGDRCRVALSKALLDKFNAKEFGALDIYLDRDRGLIGIEIIKNGFVRFAPKASGTVVRKADYTCREIRHAIESFGITLDRSISVKIHDVSDRVPPVQLEIRVDEIRAAIKEAKAAGK